MSEHMTEQEQSNVIPLSRCYCDEPDVYDGYAECERHPE